MYYNTVGKTKRTFDSVGIVAWEVTVAPPPKKKEEERYSLFLMLDRPQKTVS
jgi:hypothetical protein